MSGSEMVIYIMVFFELISSVYLYVYKTYGIHEAYNNLSWLQ